MTRPIRRRPEAARERRRPGRLARAALALALCACAPRVPAADGKETLPMNQAKLWELVDALGKAIPFRKEPVEALLRVALEVRDQDDQRLYYRARSLAPGPEGVALSAVDLRVHKTSRTWPGFLVLGLRDSGISRAEVERRFPGGQLVLPRPGPPPQGISPENHVSYVVATSWGKLSLGFKVKAPDVLDSIAFDAFPGK